MQTECKIPELKDRNEICKVAAGLHDFARSGFMLEQNAKFCEFACLQEMYRLGKHDEVTSDDLVDSADNYFVIRERSGENPFYSVVNYGFFLAEYAQGYLSHARKVLEKCKKHFSPERAENMVALMEASISQFEDQLQGADVILDTVKDMMERGIMKMDVYVIARKLDEEFLGY